VILDEAFYLRAGEDAAVGAVFLRTPQANGYDTPIKHKATQFVALQ